MIQTLTPFCIAVYAHSDSMEVSHGTVTRVSEVLLRAALSDREPPVSHARLSHVES